MPQNRFKRSSKPPDLPAKPRSTTPASATNNTERIDSSSWQRSQGAFSSKAKKDYLKWKRQQKAAATSATDSDTDTLATQQALSSNQHTEDSDSACPATVAANSSTASAAEATKHVEQTQTSTPADDPSLPLQYRPLVAVPYQPFTAAAAAAATAARNPIRPNTDLHTKTSTQSSAAAAAASCLPSAVNAVEGAAATAAAAAAAAASPSVIYLPLLKPAEVGFTAAGFELDMPTRPDWQGVVSSAEELHDLEEQQFEAWQKSLLQKAGLEASTHQSVEIDEHCQKQYPQQQQQQQTSRAGGVGRLSFYEGRLEFWRQLWRTLEMSDVVLMIVDARNPLLHFSYALYRHITQHHQLPLIVLLNKCDLIPAAAAAAWQQWLQQQLPGVEVVQVSAAEGQADAAAKAILDMVLKCDVRRAGQVVKVEKFVASSVDEILQASHTRNTHAKRQVQQQRNRTAASAIPEGASRSLIDDGDESNDDDHHHHSDHHDVDDHDGSGMDPDSDDESWSLKPAKLARKAGRKAGRSKRGKQQQQQPQHVQKQDSNAEDSDASVASDLDEESAVLTARIESLTLERRLSNNAESSIAQAAAAAAAVTPDPAAAAGVSSSSSRDLWDIDDRPVVVGLLGEPNVGKSSTLNSLLGAHRVAVSCHPGRTKHYQTHFMTDRLVLCDCPGIVFPRLDVSMPMQVLFGSYPIASCRQPYAVVRYLAEASWPRLHIKLGLRTSQQDNSTAAAAARNNLDLSKQARMNEKCTDGSCIGAHTLTSSSKNEYATASSGGGSISDDGDCWSPFELCEALAEKRRWVLPRSGRLDTYRAANWLLRAALGGREGLGLAFMPPNLQNHPK